MESERDVEAFVDCHSAREVHGVEAWVLHGRDELIMFPRHQRRLKNSSVALSDESNVRVWSGELGP